MYAIPVIGLILFVIVVAFLFIELHKVNKIVIEKYKKSPDEYYLLMDLFGQYWVIDKK